MITLKIDNNNVTDPPIVANLFNTYFLSIIDSVNMGENKHTGQKMTNPIEYLVNNYQQPFPKIIWHNTSTQELDKIIKPLKNKDSSGYDEISTSILKLSAPYILSPLTNICNKILNTGIYPDRLKYATVKPIFKKGDEWDISNYRPISLLTSFSKVVKKTYIRQITRSYYCKFYPM